MKKLLLILIPFLIAAAPTRNYDFVAQTTIVSDQVDEEFDDLYGYLQTGIDSIRASGIDAISEFAASILSGSDQNLVTGTSGSTNEFGVWNSDGDMVGLSVMTGLSSGIKMSIGTEITSNLILSGYDCSSMTSGGKLTVLSNGNVVCQPETGGSGSAITLDIGDDSGNDSTDLTEIATTGDTNSIITESASDKMLIDMGQNWPTADTASTGDSATSFFSSGTIELERGGLETDISAYTGLLAVSSGAASEVDNSTELLNQIEDETGSGLLVFNDTPTMTGVTVQTTWVFEESDGTDIMTGAVGGIKVTGDQEITGLLTLSGIDCSGNSNDGSLTTDASGRVICSDDDSGAGGTDDQTIDVFTFSDPNISLSLEDDGEATQTLDISGLNLDPDNLDDEDQGDVNISSDTWQVEATQANAVDSDSYVDDSIDEAHLSSGFLSLKVHSAKLSGDCAVNGDAANATGPAIEGGETAWTVLFDDDADEGACWQFVMPETYNGGAIDVRLLYKHVATTCEVTWEAAWCADTDGESVESVGCGAYNTTLVTTPGTAGLLDTAVVAFTNSADAGSVVKGDFVALQISTDADGGAGVDDCVGDSELLAILVEW